MTQWITSKEAGDILGVLPRRVQTLANEGRIKGWKPNPRVLLLCRESVTEFAKLDRPVGRPPSQVSS